MSANASAWEYMSDNENQQISVENETETAITTAALLLPYACTYGDSEQPHWQQ
jgi:hypothetical protein